MAFDTILGVDCATKATAVGLARAVRHGGGWRLTDARAGSHDQPPAQVLARWLEDDPAALLALDAPLGWPTALADELPSHRAGAPLIAPAARLFGRATDRFVHATFGKRPLEVGAERIARTARATLQLLQELRDASGAELPLAWRPDQPGPAAIEVYPAGTLRAHGHRASGYKGPNDAWARRTILDRLRLHLDVDADAEALVVDPDVLDAALCVLAGIDFVSGRALPPDDLATAEREGWIWIRGPARPPGRG